MKINWNKLVNLVFAAGAFVSSRVDGDSNTESLLWFAAALLLYEQIDKIFFESNAKKDKQDNPPDDTAGAVEAESRCPFHSVSA